MRNYQVELAREGLRKGVSIINEISAVNSDEILQLIAKELCPVILMHTRGSIEDHQKFADYNDFLEEVISEMNSKLNRALLAGIPRWNIMTSPGFGFAKKKEQSLDLLKNLDIFKARTGGFPLVSGFSNKGFVSKKQNLIILRRIMFYLLNKYFFSKIIKRGSIWSE